MEALLYRILFRSCTGPCHFTDYRRCHTGVPAGEYRFFLLYTSMGRLHFSRFRFLGPCGCSYLRCLPPDICTAVKRGSSRASTTAMNTRDTPLSGPRSCKISGRFSTRQPFHQGGFENPVTPACPDSRKRSRLFLFAKVWLYSQTVQSVCPCQIEKPFQAGPLKSACAPAKI